MRYHLIVLVELDLGFEKEKEEGRALASVRSTSFKGSSALRSQEGVAKGNERMLPRTALRYRKKISQNRTITMYIISYHIISYDIISYDIIYLHLQHINIFLYYHLVISTLSYMYK